MKVLMTCGGTAGHVNPAIAIANTIKGYEKDCEIEFVCSSLANDKASDLVVRAGYNKLHTVDICGSYPIWNPKNIKTVCLMIKSKAQAKKIIKELRPDVIIGTGGFACFPVLSVGASLGIPSIVHESNAIPGKAVKCLRKKIDCVMTNFESSAGLLSDSKRVVCVGNPQLIGQKSSAEKRKIAEGFDMSVLSFGGSLGSETLNRAYAKALVFLADKYPNVEFYHAAGKRDYEALKEVFSKSGLTDKKNVKLVDYIYDMDARMKRADVVISRAGAMTLSELALLSKASVLVPSPFVAANHQYKNAKAISDKGGCILVEESEFDSGKLTEAIEKLLTNPEKRRLLGEKIRVFAKPDANRIIYDEIKKVIAEKTKAKE